MDNATARSWWVSDSNPWFLNFLTVYFKDSIDTSGFAYFVAVCGIVSEDDDAMFICD